MGTQLQVMRNQIGMYVVSGGGGSKEGVFKVIMVESAFKAIFGIRHLRKGTGRILRRINDKWEAV
jgi:hypothetical protein